MAAMGGEGESQVDIRENAYRLFSGCPNLVMDLQVESVLGLLQQGLRDPFSIEVRFVLNFVNHAFE